MWIFLGCILTMAYETTLLSSLIPIQYEETIDNFRDLDNSGLPLLVVKGTVIQDYISSDPSPIMKRISNRMILFNVEGGIPQWVIDM